MRAGKKLSLAICAATTLGFIVAAIWVLTIPNGWIAALIFLPFIGVMAWLTRAVWRDARGIEPPGLLQPDPHNPQVLVWQSSRARAWGSFVAAGLFALLTAGLLAASVAAPLAGTFTAGEAIAVTAILALTALAFGGLTSLMWRNAVGFNGARVELAPDVLHLKLPRWRSLIHRPPAHNSAMSWAQVAGIATRLEAYSSQGMAMLQREYWLVQDNAPPILLFEDRGIDSPQATRSLEPVARAIAARGGGQWFELPMAEGHGGLLCAWFTAPPPDRPEPLTPERAQKLKSRVRLTAELGAYAFALVMFARAVAWMLE